MGKANIKNEVEKVSKEIDKLEDKGPVKVSEKVNESVDIHYVQLQNQVLAERADKEYYKNLVSSFIEYLDAEQTQINQNRQIFKKALMNPPSVRSVVNEKTSLTTDKVVGKEEPKKEDNKNKKKKK
jgi:hypothetical protein